LEKSSIDPKNTITMKSVIWGMIPSEFLKYTSNNPSIDETSTVSGSDVGWWIYTVELEDSQVVWYAHPVALQIYKSTKFDES